MWWRRPRDQSLVTPDMIGALSTAFAEALKSTFEAQTRSIEQNTKFLDFLQGMSARQAARVIGMRSGEVRRERAAARPKPPKCALCANPMRRDVSIAMIQAHREHAPDEPVLDRQLSLVKKEEEQKSG